MKPVYQETYWVVTLFEYEYDDDLYIIRTINVTDQEAFIAKGICIPHEPDLDTYWKSKYAGTHSIMYLLPLENQGMPSSENRFIFPNNLIFKRESDARKCAEKLLDKYVIETVENNLKDTWEIIQFGRRNYKNIKRVLHILEFIAGIMNN
mgnify:CR=1 FL=1